MKRPTAVECDTIRMVRNPVERGIYGHCIARIKDIWWPATTQIKLNAMVFRRNCKSARIVLTSPIFIDVRKNHYFSLNIMGRKRRYSTINDLIIIIRIFLFIFSNMKIIECFHGNQLIEIIEPKLTSVLTWLICIILTSRSLKSFSLLLIVSLITLRL